MQGAFLLIALLHMTAAVRMKHWLQTVRPISLFASGTSRTLVTSRSATSSLQEMNSKAFTHEDLSSETLYILDGTAMLFQSYYSKSNEFKDAIFTKEFTNKLMSTLSDDKRIALEEFLIEKSGVNGELDASLTCSALVLMATHFARFVQDVKPTYLAVAFDTSRSTLQRMVQLPSYKAHRKPTNLDLIPQLIAAPHLLSALGCRCFSAEGFEADDIMATLSSWARGRGMNAVHVSIDKDMLQLISTGVHVMQPRNFDLVSEADVLEKFGVRPDQLCDLLALTGDSVDNIPGARNIGPKIAAKLISTFGSLEALFRSLHIDVERRAEDDLEENYHALKTAEQKAAALQRLRDDLGEEKMQQALAVLSKQQEKPSSKSPLTLLASLHHMGIRRARLYRDLVRLNSEVPLYSALQFNDSPLNIHSDGIHDGSQSIQCSTTEAASYSGDAISNDAFYSAFFRFTGEVRAHSSQHRHALQLGSDTNGIVHRVDAEVFVNRMSRHLQQPLQKLREQYHKLDRSL